METIFRYEKNQCSLEARDGDARIQREVSLQDLPSQERPRERILAHGPDVLSDRDLLAVILNAGIRGKNVRLLAAELIDRLDGEKGIPSVKDLTVLGGMGESKACAIVAMLEYGRRRWGVGGSRINNPIDAYSLVRHYADRRQERFICLSLNGAHNVLAVRIVTIGLVNRTIIHPREVFSDPLMDRASAVIIAHNHPSGRLIPSAEDDEITDRLKGAADVLGIGLLDHLIFSETDFFSYSQNGKIIN